MRRKQVIPKEIEGGAKDPALEFQFPHYFQAGVGIVVIAIGLFQLSIVKTRDASIVFTIAILVGLFVLAGWFLSPQYLAIDGRKLRVRYPLKEVSYSVEEIRAVSLKRQISRYGYITIVQIHLKTGKRLELTHPDKDRLYQALRKWHDQFSQLTDSSPF